MSAHGHAIEEHVVHGISSYDEPSVRWGWHQHSRKIGQPVGWFFVVFLLLMLFGNHIGRVEDIYLVSFAVVIAVCLVAAALPHKDKTAKKNRVLELPSDHYSVEGSASRRAIGAGAAQASAAN